MTTAAKPEMPVKETMFRGSRASVNRETVNVSRHGGNNGAGLLSGVSLIAKGEALGHDMWIDETTLEQVAESASLGKSGIKSRFTHPSMSADGMGRHLGRLQDVRVEGERVIGDLHFAESSHKTPDGNLADYVMDLAEEDPEAAGLSIVFEHDFEATSSFAEEHGGENFQSPDENNVNNFVHVRLAKLRAADIVDEPAANPDGLFDRQTLPRSVDDLLSYAAGLTEDKPSTVAFGVDADRASQFLGRWLDGHGLSIVPKKVESSMNDAPEAATEAPEAPVPTRDEFLSELKRYTDKFGAENGQKWFEEGKDFAEAIELHCDTLSAHIESLKSDIAEQFEKLSSLQLGELEPVETGTSQDTSKRTFAEHTKASRN